MNTYSHEITKLTCQDGLEVSNYVYTVHYTYSATDGTNTVSTNRTVIFPYSTDQSNYVAFADLTSEIVWSWISSKNKGIDILNLQNMLDKELELKKKTTPTFTEVDLPWS